MDRVNKLPIVFLDRDGTIIVDKVYLNDPKEVEFIDGVIDGLKKLSENNFKLIIVSNQSGIARGLVQIENLNEIHKVITETLKKHNVEIFRIYYCPHLPQDNCECRKPKTGMVKEILDFIDKDKSFVIGDKESDVEFGLAVGIKTIILSNREISTRAHFVARNFKEAVDFILSSIKYEK